MPIREARIANINEKYMTLENISCVSGFRCIEFHSKLIVNKDFERMSGNYIIRRGVYYWVQHLERNDSFLMSLPLKCNILNLLYRNKSDSEVDKILKNFSRGSACNTIFSLPKHEIVHYPLDCDFDCGEGNVNSRPFRVAFGFSESGLGNNSIESYLDNNKEFLTDLTGLNWPDTEVLVDISRHLGEIPLVVFNWPPGLDYDFFGIRTASIGTYLRRGGFNLVPYLELDRELPAIRARKEH